MAGVVAARRETVAQIDFLAKAIDVHALALRGATAQYR
jgi:hypothetical protein